VGLPGVAYMTFQVRGKKNGSRKRCIKAPLTPSALEGIKTSSHHALLEILHMEKESKPLPGQGRSFLENRD